MIFPLHHHDGVFLFQHSASLIPAFVRPAEPSLIVSCCFCFLVSSDLSFGPCFQKTCKQRRKGAQPPQAAKSR